MPSANLVYRDDTDLPSQGPRNGLRGIMTTEEAGGSQALLLPRPGLGYEEGLTIVGDLGNH